MFSVLIAVVVAAVAPSLAQATSITEFSSGLGAGSPTTLHFGNQQITLTSPSALPCTAKANTLGVGLSSTAIPQSHGARLRFVSASFYLDKGVRHTRKKTGDPRHGSKKTVTVTKTLTVKFRGCS